MQSSKILLFGGTFDPFHLGHYTILKQAQKLVNPNKTIVIVNNISPFKTQTPPSSSADRLEMVRLALKDEQNLEISDFELNQNKPSFTIDTIRHFHNLYKSSELYLLIGADQYKDFHLWHEYEQIMQLANIIVAKRDGQDINNPLLGKYEPLTIPGLEFHVSSTSLRIAPQPYLLNYEVLQFINNQGLYAIERIKPILSEHRFKHSLRVAHMARDLMDKYDSSQSHLAYTAGIYHDIAKEMNYDQQENIAKNILGINSYDHVKVLHGYIGGYLLRQNYWFDNKLILDAIARHTKPFDYYTDQPNLLDKVLYLADKLEANRNNDDVFGQDINTYRQLAYKNVDECFNKLYNWLQFNLTKK